MTEWLQTEIAEKVIVETTEDPQVFKLWCEGSDTTKKIWETKDKWEENGMGKIEEWKSIVGRKARPGHWRK